MKALFFLRRCWLLGLPLLWAGCTPAPQPIARHVEVASVKPVSSAAASAAPPSPPPREQPPASGPVLDQPLPRATWSKLSNGLTYGTLPLSGLPLVEVRVTIAGGRSAETNQLGVADVLGEVLQQSIRNLESLGVEAEVEVSNDKLRVRLSVLASELEGTLTQLGEALKTPRFDKKAAEKIRQRLEADAAETMREDGPSMGEFMLHRALFSTATGLHPYARAGVVPGELDKLTLDAVRAFHEQNVTPNNMAVLVAGAIDSAATAKLVTKVFSALKDKPTNSVVWPETTKRLARQVVVVHMPKAERSHVFVGTFGPRSVDGDYAAFSVLDQLLGKKGTGRLFLDVRENRSLAYTARTLHAEFSHGPQVFMAYVETQTVKTEAAVGAVLENLERLGKEAPPIEEIDIARAASRGALMNELETTADIADVIADMQHRGLPAEHRDQHRKAIDAVTPDAIRSVAAQWLVPGREVVVVVGDGDELAQKLTKFGAVDVVDAAKGFALLRQLQVQGH